MLEYWKDGVLAKGIQLNVALFQYSHIPCTPKEAEPMEVMRVGGLLSL